MMRHREICNLPKGETFSQAMQPGIVVSGDLKRHEGAAVKIGQSLYEVAPLEKLVAEVAIPEEELEFELNDEQNAVGEKDAVYAQPTPSEIELEDDIPNGVTNSTLTVCTALPAVGAHSWV